MDLNTSVFIVSVHGRGSWLAAELQRESIPVVLVELTSKLGAWPPEDRDGPFGLFHREDFSGTQEERIHAEDPFESVDHGFTVWLPNGPLEMKSPLTPYRLQKEGQNIVVSETLLSAKSGSKLVPGMQKWAADNFKKSWILHLAHHWAATTYVPSSRASLAGRALKLMSSFSVRKATRSGQQRLAAWVREKNVEVHQDTEVLDLSFASSKQISGVEIQGERSGLVQVDQLVWLLNSEESYFVAPKIAKHLFPAGPEEPEWCWVRYRLKLAECPEREALPLHMVVLGQVMEPWTHQNLMTIQRTASSELFDVWIRIPNVQRFNKEYLRIRGEKVMEILRERLPLALPEIQSYPQEFYYTYTQIGPSPFPVYGPTKKPPRGRKSFQNLHLGGAEMWRNYSWEDQFENQTLIRDSLIKWWKVLQQKKEKELHD